MSKHISHMPNRIDTITLATGNKAHDERSLSFPRKRAKWRIRPLEQGLGFFGINKKWLDDPTEEIFDMCSDNQRDTR